MLVLLRNQLGDLVVRQNTVHTSSYGARFEVRNRTLIAVRLQLRVVSQQLGGGWNSYVAMGQY